jgi:Fe-S-cluster containining protein
MKNKCEHCGKCCYDTEMILSSQDIDFIIKNSSKVLKKEDFTFKNNDGFYRLKNQMGYCVFLDITSNKCKIYEFRPQGCKFYPLIYDFFKSKCILDEDCPRTHLFYQNRKEFETICKKLKKFIKSQSKLNST